MSRKISHVQFAVFESINLASRAHNPQLDAALTQSILEHRRPKKEGRKPLVPATAVKHVKKIETKNKNVAPQKNRVFADFCLGKEVWEGG